MQKKRRSTLSFASMMRKKEKEKEKEKRSPPRKNISFLSSSSSSRSSSSSPTSPQLPYPSSSSSSPSVVGFSFEHENKPQFHGKKSTCSKSLSSENDVLDTLTPLSLSLSFEADQLQSSSNGPVPPFKQSPDHKHLKTNHKSAPSIHTFVAELSSQEGDFSPRWQEGSNGDQAEDFEEPSQGSQTPSLENDSPSPQPAENSSTSSSSSSTPKQLGPRSSSTPSLAFKRSTKQHHIKSQLINHEDSLAASGPTKIQQSSSQLQRSPLQRPSSQLHQEPSKIQTRSPRISRGKYARSMSISPRDTYSNSPTPRSCQVETIKSGPSTPTSGQIDSSSTASNFFKRGKRTEEKKVTIRYLSPILSDHFGLSGFLLQCILSLVDDADPSRFKYVNSLVSLVKEPSGLFLACLVKEKNKAEQLGVLLRQTSPTVCVFRYIVEPYSAIMGASCSALLKLGRRLTAKQINLLLAPEPDKAAYALKEKIQAAMNTLFNVPSRVPFAICKIFYQAAKIIQSDERLNIPENLLLPICCWPVSALLFLRVIVPIFTSGGKPGTVLFGKLLMKLCCQSEFNQWDCIMNQTLHDNTPRFVLFCEEIIQKGEHVLTSGLNFEPYVHPEATAQSIRSMTEFLVANQRTIQTEMRAEPNGKELHFNFRYFLSQLDFSQPNSSSPLPTRRSDSLDSFDASSNSSNGLGESGSADSLFKFAKRKLQKIELGGNAESSSGGSMGSGSGTLMKSESGGSFESVTSPTMKKTKKKNKREKGKGEEKELEHSGGGTEEAELEEKRLEEPEEDPEGHDSCDESEWYILGPTFFEMKDLEKPAGFPQEDNTETSEMFILGIQSQYTTRHRSSSHEQQRTHDDVLSEQFLSSSSSGTRRPTSLLQSTFVQTLSTKNKSILGSSWPKTDDDETEMYIVEVGGHSNHSQSPPLTILQEKKRKDLKDKTTPPRQSKRVLRREETEATIFLIEDKHNDVFSDSLEEKTDKKKKKKDRDKAKEKEQEKKTKNPTRVQKPRKLDVISPSMHFKEEEEQDSNSQDDTEIIIIGVEEENGSDDEMYITEIVTTVKSEKDDRKG